jgi:hypothetical protein
VYLDTGESFVVMISQERLAREFTQVIDRIYPKTGKLLHKCYVKVVEFYLRRLRKRYYYITIYCPEYLSSSLQLHKHLLKEVAENMGLIDVVFVNATRLLRDPMSKIKQEDARFWLELHWLVSQED